MNPKPKSKSAQTILWWIAWITATIASFFVAAVVWTPIIAKQFGSIYETKAGIIWVAAVFGTWMIFLIPLIVFMYQKVDKAYEDARMNREKAATRFRSLELDREKRMLSSDLTNKLTGEPETIPGGHLVTVTLQSGQKFQNVFIQNKNEILGIYDEREMPFEASEVTDIVLADTNNLPAFQTNRWLRLDGITAD